MNNEEIKNWFTGQHIQPVMLRQDWKQVILSKHLYTDNDVIELLTEFNKLLSQPTQGEGEKTLDELRAEFSREAEINIPMVIEMNIRNSGRNVLHKYIEWLEQKLTGKE